MLTSENPEIDRTYKDTPTVTATPGKIQTVGDKRVSIVS